MENHIDLTTMNSECIQQWMMGKNPVCAYIAVNVVASTDSTHQIIIALQQINIAQQMDDEDVTLWLELCRHPRLFNEFIFTGLLNQYIPAPLAQSGILRILRIAAKCNMRQRERLGKILFQNVSEKDVENIMQETVNSLDDDVEDTITEIVNRPEDDSTAKLNLGQLFTFNNILRCQIEYTEPFYDLYHKARTGNPEAIIKLLRLDPLVLKDRFILRHFLSAETALQKKYQTAINNPLKYHTKPEKIKATMSGFISALFEGLTGTPITPQEIFDLFVAYAGDVHQTDSDDNLPDEFEAFRKSVKRHHQLWEPMIARVRKALS